MALLGRVAGFLDKYLFGYALGVASGPALEPFVQPLANEAWTLNPDKPPDPYFIAQGVAQKQVDAGQAKTWALQVGLGDTQWNALLAAADTGPGVAMAYQLRRRGRIGDAEFRTALKREAIEDQFDSCWKCAGSAEPSPPSKGWSHRAKICCGLGVAFELSLDL